MVMAKARPTPPRRRNRICRTILVRYKGFDSSSDSILERSSRIAPVADAIIGTAAWTCEIYGNGICSKRRVDIAGKNTKTNPPRIDSPSIP